MPDLDLAATARLLHEVFGLKAFEGSETLRWLYADAPEGRVICTEEREGSDVLAHYAVVPQTWHATAGELPMALSLNTAVHRRARGRGLFTRLAEETYAQARDRGVAAVVGVANANSTHGFVKRLGFRLLGQLPVRVIVRRPRIVRDVESVTGRSAFLDSRAFEDHIARLDLGPREAWSRQWTAERLRWRLRCPTSELWLHTSAAGALVSCLERQRSVPFAVVLKVFRAPGATDRDVGRLVDAACATHFTPLVVTAGRATWRAGLSLPLPDKLRPSPLNVIFRSLDPERIPQDGPDVEFEFLDFDAY